MDRDRKKHIRLPVRMAKDAWFQHKAMEVERGRHYGKMSGVASETSRED